MDRSPEKYIKISLGAVATYAAENAAYVLDEITKGRYRVMLRTEHVGTLIDTTCYWMAEHHGRTYGPFRSRDAAIRTLIGLDQSSYPQTPGKSCPSTARKSYLH